MSTTKIISDSANAVIASSNQDLRIARESSDFDTKPVLTSGKIIFGKTPENTRTCLYQSALHSADTEAVLREYTAREGARIYEIVIALEKMRAE